MIDPIYIDINCDMGESYAESIVGNDVAIMPWISSSNIACGFHGGDPQVIEDTIDLAIKYSVRIAAHPSYPDLEGFGRRRMEMPYQQLIDTVKHQIEIIKENTARKGAKLSYIKPHGALYNEAAKDEEVGRAIIQAIQELDPQLALMGLPNSLLEQLAAQQRIRYIREAFIDRLYESDGTLVNRKLEGAVLTNVKQATRQFVGLVKGEVVTRDGSLLSIQADSFCLHGDNPVAYEIIKSIHMEMSNMNLELKRWSH
ncbi:LamB/YcsF family protein [Reichenbachiella agarivorans]|uniref:LamB/YcsF family protein n=1 Tax=Reichenbachiella agarivorans TaxID=2979464 RepID=A0ABY6CS85_9BACT|nr:5-oxoprolinase subunit PxpA [Reichenbachiella agarivorans]UXP32233.1 LamB/YcsF family protein [Reichenbachiella agarivorans]